MSRSMSLRRFTPAATCAAWLIASAALAQLAPAAPKPGKPASTTVGEVVVQGRPPVVPRSFAKAVQKFVHDQGAAGPFGQVSRWGTPICPATAGLTSGFDDFVNRRIRDVAARVGASVSGDCREGPNVLVIFTTRPDELMADVRRHHEGLLGYHFVGQTKALAKFEPPMKSWYVTMTGIPGLGARIDQAYAPGPPGGTGSHIPPPLESRFAFVLVVADANLLEGQEIGSVADRIAMLALSRPSPRDSCGALPSILDFLDPKCPSGAPAELTSYDEAYLRGLYAYKGSELRYFERNSIAKQVQNVAPPPPVAQ